MDIGKLVEMHIENVQDGNFDKESLLSCLNQIKKIIPKAQLTNSLIIKNDDLETQLTTLQIEDKVLRKEKERLLAHAEELEPLFEELKKKTIGRLKLLEMSEDSLDSISKKINSSEYSIEIMDIISLTELKTKKTFSENKIEKKLSYKNIINNPNNYKSGV